MRWRQSFWFALENLSAAALQLLLSLCLIRVLGIAAFGEWMQVWAAVSLCGLASAGLAPGLSLRIQAETEAQARAALLGGALRLAVTLSALLFLPAAGLSFALRGAETALPANGYWLPLMLLQVLGNEVVVLLAATLRGLGDYRSSALTQAVTRTLWAVGVVAVAVYFPSLDTLLLVTSLVTALQAGWLLRCLRRRGQYLPVRSAFTTRSDDGLLQDARWQWLKAGAGLLYGSADRLLVGHLLGVRVLAVYVVCLQLAEPLHRIAAMLTQPLMLWAGRLRTGSAKLTAQLRELCAIEVLVILCGAALAALAPWLLPWWLGADAAQHVGDLRLAIVAATLTALCALPHQLQIGLGMLRRVAWLSLLGAVLALAAIALTHRQGLEAVMLSRWLYGLCLFASWPALWRALRGLLSRSGEALD